MLQRTKLINEAYRLNPILRDQWNDVLLDVLLCVLQCFEFKTNRKPIKLPKQINQIFQKTYFFLIFENIKHGEIFPIFHVANYLNIDRCQHANAL